MSYLSFPRLVFSGQFQADPSTVNNDPEHFDSAAFKANYQQPGQGATNGWWNPDGSAAWRFRGCTVRQVFYRDGTTCTDSAADPIVGAAVNDDESGTEGKLVDLDTEQQMVSQIWGFKVLVGGPTAGFGFTSDFDVAAFADIWLRFPKGQPDSFFGAFYQSVLSAIEWAGTGESRFLKELAAGGTPKRLSIKFNVDGYQDDSTSDQFTFGRVVGTIGPYASGEPKHFLAARALNAAPKSPLNTTYAQINGHTLSVDLGNSLPTQAPGGSLADLGPLDVVLLGTSGPVTLGQVTGYASSGWYDQTAGIVSFSLDAAQLQQASQTPIGIQRAGQTVLAEAPDGSWLRADNFVFRLNPGDHANATFHSTKFGRPVAHQQITLAYDASSMDGQRVQGPIPGPLCVGTPQSALTFPTSITTGPDGTAELALHAGDPGQPRSYVDGQVYGVTYAMGNTAPPYGSVGNPSLTLNALVWSGYAAPKHPTWQHDVQPIFQQYANLYPVMKPIVDLSDYHSVVAKAAAIKRVFSVPMTDPRYMPVTRDLSRARREMILKWLDHPLP